MKNFTLLFGLLVGCFSTLAQVPTNGLVAYYPFNGNANDAVGTNHGTVNGATLTTDRFGQSNKAYNFDGNDAINTNSQSNITGNAPRSISVWFNSANTSSILKTIVKAGTNGTGNDFSLLVETNSNNQVRLYVRRYFEDIPSVYTSGSINNWYHAMVVYDGTTTHNMKFYLNGQRINTSTQYANVSFNTASTNFTFGNLIDQSNNNSFFTGKLDDIRIYNRALTDTEVQALYQAEAPPIDLTTGLVAHYKMDGNAQDAVGTNHGTVNGATLTTDRRGGAASAYSFNGINNYIQVPHSATFNITGAITLSVWLSSNTISSQRIIDKTTVSMADAWMADLRPDGRIRFIVANPPAGTPQPQSNVVFNNTNVWYHFVVAYDNSNVKFYKDGILVNTVAKTGSSTTNTNPLRFGANSLLNGDWFNGKLDDIRIYNRALTDTEVQALYQAEAPPIDITTGLVAHYKMDGNAQDASGNSNHGTPQGGVNFTTATDRFGVAGKAAGFDGTSSLISVPNSSTIQNINSITLSTWVNYATLAADGTIPILDKSNSSTGGQYFLRLYNNGSNSFSGTLNGKHGGLPFSGIQANIWYHLSMVSFNNSFTFYLNGLKIGSVAGTSTTFSNTMPLTIGANPSGILEVLNGKLDDIRIYNRALSDAEVGALYASENVGFQNINPMISYGAGTVNRFTQPTTSNQVLIVNGTNFTPNTNALLTVSCPNGTRNFSVGVGANAQFSYPVVVDNTYSEGSCTVSVKDISTKITQIPLNFTVLAGISSFDNYLKINNVNASLATQWSVGWSDAMFKATQYGNSSLRSYRYQIEYGLADGSGQVSTWYSAGLYPANSASQAIVGELKNFTLTFVPTQATTAGNYVIRITDYLTNTRKTTSQSFAFNPATVPSNTINFQWDFTSGNRTNVVEGVAADSTSRFYIKVTPNVSGVARVEAQIKDPDFPTNTETRVLGKLMQATVINQFSPEANTANAILLSNNQPVGADYWFWYVAPDDFARSSVLDKNAEERKVELTVRFYNSANALIATSVKQIRIARPPLMLVHGLGGDKNTWDDFRHDGKKFIHDNVFKICNVLEMYGNKAFNDNSKVLLGYDNLKKEYSFENTLNEMRNLGFASNRVDYVCHSMGGSMLRNTLHVPTFKQDFYNIYKNYGKGFVNKFITLDTPHWGSPLGDIVTEFAPYMNGESWPVSTLNSIASEQLSAFMNFQYQTFTETVTPPAGSPFIVQNARLQGISATNAVRDLSYRNGVRFGSANLNNHVIVGDYVRKYGILPETAIVKSYTGTLKGDFGGAGLPILSEFLMAGANKKFNACNCKPELNSLENIRGTENNYESIGGGRTIKFMNFQSSRVYPAGETFFQNSDMIVSVESQANGKIRLGTNTVPVGVSVYEDISHSAKPDKVVDNETVGNKVYLLLNTPLSSADFAKSMQAAPAINSPYSCATTCTTTSNTLAGKNPEKNKTQNFGGGNKIQINQPITGSNIAAMSQLNTQITVLDTVRLFYVETKFQDTRAVESNKKQSLTYKFQADGKALGWQQMLASAVYKNVDSTFTTYTDTVWVNVTTSVPLTSISANKEIYKMIVGDKQYVDLTAYHESFSTGISFTNSNLTIVVQDPTIIQYDSNKGVFTALKDGVTSAIATLNGQQTDILFYVDCGANLYTVQSGNWNNPTTWSCGRVPTVNDNVTIKAGHLVNLLSGEFGQCRTIVTEPSAVFNCSTGAIFLSNPNP